jgi:glycosyltransferase involved in cell wall biosynthesis
MMGLAQRIDQDHRILHVHWSLEIGGAERALYQLIRAQREAGSEVALLTVSCRGLYGEQLQAEGFEVFALDQASGLNLTTLRTARRFFDRWPIVHFHGCEPGIMLAAASSGTRAFYTHRAGAFEYRGRRRLRYALGGKVLRRSFAGVAGNTRHAADVASRLFSIPRERVATVYNGIDWALLRASRSSEAVRSELDVPPDKVVVGTSGNIRDCKRMDIAVRAIDRAGEGVMLVVVGDGPDRPHLEKLVADLGVETQVRFPGTTTNMADYLQVFDAFILPSGPEESFGNSAVEALGFGIPTIVMSDGGGLLEHVVDGVTGLVADSIEGVAEAISQLASDRQLRLSLGRRACVETRRRYTTEAMVAGYARLYEGGTLGGACESVLAQSSGSRD